MSATLENIYFLKHNSFSNQPTTESGFGAAEQPAKNKDIER